MKEILRHYDWLNATVSKHRREANSISEKSYKIANQLDLTPKEISIKAIETAKNKKKRKKPKQKD